MRRGWKRLAERAANVAFDDKEKTEALADALLGDWVNEVPHGFVRKLRTSLDDHQGYLFVESVAEQLETLRGEAAGRPLANAVLDSALHAVEHGHRGSEALSNATADALRERAVSSRRQVEEHWQRASSARKAGYVGSRISDIIAASDVDAIARSCLACTDEGASQAPRKKTGIDHGVPLP